MQNGIEKLSSAAEKRYPEMASAARSGVDDVKGRLAETADTIAETAREGYDAAKEKAAEKMQQGKELVDEARTEVSRALSDFVGVVSDSLAENVRSRPVAAIGLAVLAGIVIGNMARR